MEPNDLIKKIEELTETGDEKQLREYITEHFEEFPEEMQGKLLLGLYTEEIEKQAGEAEIARIQKEGMDAMEQIAALKAALETPASGHNPSTSQ